MEDLIKKQKQLKLALDRLKEALDYRRRLQQNTPKIPVCIPEFMNTSQLDESLRDSLIQRFEFCTDLFWKCLKKYLESVVKVPITVHGPGYVIKAACQAKIIAEKDGELLLQMIDHRNLTSHTYKVDLAEIISLEIPQYYQIMRKYADQLAK